MTTRKSLLKLLYTSLRHIKDGSTTGAALCAFLCICAALNFGSWQVLWALPFVVASVFFCVIRRNF
jgi:hypothetical protein